MSRAPRPGTVGGFALRNRRGSRNGRPRHGAAGTRGHRTGEERGRSVETILVPDPGPGEAVVKIQACGVCHMPWQLEDHAALRAAGGRPRLVVGPWVHADLKGAAAGLREALAGFDRAFGTVATGGAPVQGHHRRTPRHADPHRGQQAAPTGRLAPARRAPPLVPAARRRARDRAAPRAAPAARPSPTTRPTRPPRWAGRSCSGRRAPATRPRSRRATTSRCSPRARSTPTSWPSDRSRRRSGCAPRCPTSTCSCGSATSTPRAVSVNVTDGLVRLDDLEPEPRVGSAGESGGLHQRRLAGGRGAVADRPPVRCKPQVRVQVSGGAHPRFARHTGTGDALADATRLVAVVREVCHDVDRPSHVTVPVEPV